MKDWWESLGYKVGRQVKLSESCMESWGNRDLVGQLGHIVSVDNEVVCVSLDASVGVMWQSINPVETFILIDPPKSKICPCGIHRQDCEYHRE